jgi:hypothetical protein
MRDKMVPMTSQGPNSAKIVRKPLFNWHLRQVSKSGLGPFLFVFGAVILALPGSRGEPASQDSARPKLATVTTGRVTTLGIDGITVNGSIHAHGVATTYYFEYGATEAYGHKTPSRPLPPRLAAFYHETWDEGAGGWDSWSKGGLAHFPKDGARGGFIRFSEPTRHDHNHDNGIGTVHLAKYIYPGTWGLLTRHATPYLGGGSPDLRDAKISIYVRGRDWKANGAELMWWTQSQSNIELLNRPGYRHHNWAYTGFSLAEHLTSGKWEKVEYRLRNDTEDWTYTGGTGIYANYWSIDNAQAQVNLDFFHMVTFVDTTKPPTGAIDFDEFELAYRNYSLVFPGNGGKLISAPPSPDNPATLTDGWRHGPGRMWKSGPNPAGALEFVYAFQNPVTIRAVQLHQNPEWASKDIEVLVSEDGKTFTSLRKKVLPEKGVPNANFAFTFDEGLSAKASSLKVRVTSGYKAEHWGLGEIEVFGDGATMLPDDDLYNVNTDLKELKPGATYHYRLVARTAAGTSHGKDKTFIVPANRKPQAVTGTASRITSHSARVQGRLSPLGLTTRFYFEYGPDTNYGRKTALTYGGLQNTPRLVFAALTGLEPATTYHYRLVAVNEQGTSLGRDAILATKAR